MAINFGAQEFRPPTIEERTKIGEIKAAILLPSVLPYMGRLGHRLRYVMADDLGSIIITNRGVVVFDSTMLKETELAELCANVAHLWVHWLMDHARRAKMVDLDEGGNFYASIWNVASDCHCLDSLSGTQLGKHMPKLLTSFSDLGIDRQDTSERTYRVLLDKFVKEKLAKEGVAASLPDDFNFDDFMNGTGSGSNPGENSSDEEEFDEDAFNGDALENEFQKMLKEAQNEHQAELDKQLQDMLDGKDAPFKGNIWDLPQELFNQGIDPFRATHKYCGSGAGHVPLDMEELIDAVLQEMGDQGLSEGEAEIVRQSVAQDLADYFKNGVGRGTMPGDFERFVDERLQKPTVPWQQKLKTSIQKPLYRKAGLVDFTYARPHRRQRPGELILPAMIGGDPGRVAVMVDTSGSMTQMDLLLSLSEVRGILEGFTVVGFAVDSYCHEIGVIKSAESFSLKGGGGTNMCVGLEVVSEAKPRFTSAVVLTDGDTPWPDSPYVTNPKLQVVAAIVTDHPEDSHVFESVPSWIDVVRIPATPRF